MTVSFNQIFATATDFLGQTTLVAFSTDFLSQTTLLAFSTDFLGQTTLVAFSDTVRTPSPQCPILALFNTD
jgi:hypothetical protein